MADIPWPENPRGYTRRQLRTIFSDALLSDFYQTYLPVAEITNVGTLYSMTDVYEFAEERA